MNNEMIRNHYDAFKRIADIRKQIGSHFAATSRATKQFDIITAEVAEMEKEGVAQLSGSTEYHGSSTSKQIAAKALRAQLVKIRETADAIAETAGLPDFDDQFTAPRSRSYTSLIITARENLAEATKHKALFLEFELEEDFLDELEDAIDDLEKEGSDQNAGISEQVGATAALRAALERGIAARTQLLPIVRNKFANNPAILAQWESAARIERSRRKPKTKPEDKP
jgi:hypothetical protein